MSVSMSGISLVANLAAMALQYFWDDNERGAYIAHKNNTETLPDMREVLKEIVLMSRNKGYDLHTDDDVDNYIIPEMFYEYPEVDIDYECYSESDDDLIDALEADALDEYFEQCYEGLCKNKFADA